MSLKEVAADVVALKNTSTLAASLIETLVDKVAELTAKCIELEQRSSNFAARVSSHNACYRSEIQALREEVLALKAGKKFTQVAQRISTAEWKAAHADLCRLNAGKTYFPAAKVREHAALLAAAPAEVKPLVGYTEGDPLLEESDEDEFSL